MAHVKYEEKYKGLVIGVDEVGRGPLAGPVVACACILPKKSLSCHIMGMITDSKKMTDKKRRLVYPQLQNETLYAFGICSVTEIDTINILNATMTAMNRAVKKLISICPSQPEHVLIDGNRVPQNIPISATPIIKGDNISLSIASASVLAKVYRDTIMQHLSQQYPVYDWHKNAGYGTKSHLNALKTHGVTPHHRRSFAPVRNILADDS